MSKNVILCAVTALVVAVVLGICYLLGNRYTVVSAHASCAFKLDRLTGQLWFCHRDGEWPVKQAD